MEENNATPEVSPATDIPARTIEPSKILTPPDMDYFNTYRVDQKEVLPHQSPPIPHRSILNPVNARRMRSISASAAFETPIKPPPIPILSPGPLPHAQMVQPQGNPNGIVTREQGIMAGEKETDGLRSPRGGRKPSDGLPQSPLSPRGEVIPTEIPGSPKRKRHTVSVGEAASAANAANGKKRRQRQKKTPTQVAVLERHFVINPHPDKQTRDTLALQLGFTSRQVQIWFQNARAKAKQNARKNGIEMTTPTMVNGAVMPPPLNGHKHPQLSMNPSNGMVGPNGNGAHQHPQQQQQQQPHTMQQPIAPAGSASAATNGGGGRKIFSPPFSTADLNPLSPPQSPISPYLSSLALSPRFPTRSIHPINPQHNPMIYNNILNNNNIHNNNNSHITSVENSSNVMTPPSLSMADVASLTGVASMEEVPSTPPVTNMLSQPVSPTQAGAVYDDMQQLTVQTAAATLQQTVTTAAPHSPPPPSSPLEDFPQLSMSAPSPYTMLQKQMLLEEDEGHSMAGVTSAEGDADYEDPFALPSSLPLPSSYGPPLVPLLPQAVFLSEQNQKAALAHLEHDSFRQQQHMFQQHTLLTQQHFMQQQQALLNNNLQQQHALAVSAQAASISSEMDFFFYEAPSKNLVQFGEGEGDGDFFWGGVDSLNP